MNLYRMRTEPLYLGLDFNFPFPKRKCETMNHVIEKVYFKPGEVREMLSISDSALRFWRHKLWPDKRRIMTKYSKEEVNELKAFRKLLNEGLTIKGAVKQLSK